MRPTSFAVTTATAIFAWIAIVVNSHAAEVDPPSGSTSPGRNASEEVKQADPDIADGKATHAWMQAQASGKLASKHRPVLTGPVMSKIQEQYIKSFESTTADTFSKTK